MLIEAAIMLPWVLWGILRLSLPSGPYEMDHGHGTAPGTFFPLLILYSVFFYIVAIAASLGAVWSIVYGFEWHPALVLLVAAIYALLFVGLLTFFYEAFMNSRYLGKSDDGPLALPLAVQKLGPSNYTLNRYAAILSLGFSSFALLVFGGLWLAAEVGR